MKKTKKVSIISANCQGSYITRLLQKHKDFSSDFEIRYSINYLKEEIPDEAIYSWELLRMLKPFNLEH